MIDKATRIMVQNGNKAIPTLRYSELNENSTRYDYLAASPPDDELVYYWYAWFAVALTVGLFSLIVFLSIVTNKKVRRKPFNLYLIYLMIPDFVFSLVCSVTCLLNAINKSYWSHPMCNFQQLYIIFGIGANAWLNAIIGHQIHTILRNSNIRRRYTLPSMRKITFQAIAVYVWIIFLGSWGTYDSSNFNFHSGLASGLACLPIEQDSASSIVFWVCFFPLFAGIPIIWVFWICWDVYHKKLLPPTGQRRLLSIYFGRLVLVFLVMWIPTLLLIFALTPYLPHWVRYAGGTWSHLQGGVSAFLILKKPDLADAFRDFIRCRCYNEEKRPIEDDLSGPAGFDLSERSRTSKGLSSSNWGFRRSTQKQALPDLSERYSSDSEDNSDENATLTEQSPRRDDELRDRPNDIGEDNDEHPGLQKSFRVCSKPNCKRCRMKRVRMMDDDNNTDSNKSDEKYATSSDSLKIDNEQLSESSHEIKSIGSSGTHPLHVGESDDEHNDLEKNIRVCSRPNCKRCQIIRIRMVEDADNAD
jgi:hypothetical protein